MMEALEPHVCGQALAGAGGGGFMYLLTKEPNAIENIKTVLAQVEVGSSFLYTFLDGRR